LWCALAHEKEEKTIWAPLHLLENHKDEANTRVTADLNPRILKLQATKAEIVFVYEPTQQL
jgi:hypothetical protein